MNTNHIVLDIEQENLSGAYCCYCGKAINSSYNREEDIYEFRCDCSKAEEEIVLLKAVNKAQVALNEFYVSNQDNIYKKTLEIKKEKFMLYALMLQDMYNDFKQTLSREKDNE